MHVFRFWGRWNRSGWPNRNTKYPACSFTPPPVRADTHHDGPLIMYTGTSFIFAAQLLSLQGVRKAPEALFGAFRAQRLQLVPGFFYEQRIRLPRKVQHSFAAKNDGDDMFTGKKFIEYPDGSVFLHVELIGESKDDYVPEERLLDPLMMKTPGAGAPVEEMDVEDVDGTTTGARELHTQDDDNNSFSRPSKRRGVQNNENKVQVETVRDDDDDDASFGDMMSDDDNDEKDDNDATSRATNPAASWEAAMAASKAERKQEAFAAAAREKGATVLEQAKNQKMSSLAQAAAKGAAAAAAATH